MPYTAAFDSMQEYDPIFGCIEDEVQRTTYRGLFNVLISQPTLDKLLSYSYEDLLGFLIFILSTHCTGVNESLFSPDNPAYDLVKEIQAYTLLANALDSVNNIIVDTTCFMACF